MPETLESPDDEIAETLPRPRRKGIYVLPNLFTLAALFGGFYAVVMAINGRFELSVYGVFCAMVLDSSPIFHRAIAAERRIRAKLLRQRMGSKSRFRWKRFLRSLSDGPGFWAA